MTILVVLVLAVIWISVLAPLGWRRLRDRRGQSSIESFHEQLHLLERTGPKIVPAAHRLETAYATTVVAPEETGYPPVPVLPPRRPSLVLITTDHRPAAPDEGIPEWVTAPARAVSDQARVRRARVERRLRARRRRRDVILGLVGVLALSAGVGSLHGLHALWGVAVVAALGLCGCVGLGAYAQMLEADRRALRPIVTSRQRDVVNAGGLALDRPELVAPALAARAGYPGAWDDEPVAAGVVHRAAVGG